MDEDGNKNASYNSFYLDKKILYKTKNAECSWAETPSCS